MPRINRSKRELSLKIVYYGAGLSGKTTNLRYLHGRYPSDTRGDLLTLDTEGERTLFFDYFESSLGKMAGFSLKADFYTVPGQSFYKKTRQVVLDGADGVVFVVDASAAREDANLMSLDDLEGHLKLSGRSLATVPHVIQYNKMDVPDALSPKLLSRLFNRHGAPEMEAVATVGTGVWETQQEILRATIESLKTRAGAVSQPRQKVTPS